MEVVEDSQGYRQIAYRGGQRNLVQCRSHQSHHPNMAHNARLNAMAKIQGRGEE
jgi:hypothetical protein